VALILPLAAVLAVRRQPQALPMAIGAVVGIALAAVPAVLLSEPYLSSIRGSLLPLVAATAVLTVLSVVVVGVAHLRGYPAGPGRHRGWGTAAAAGVLLLGVGLATRPLWQVSRQDPDDPGAIYVAALQASQHLPVDGGRTYAESSLQWVSWWIGPVGVVAAWVAFAVLAGRGVRWWTGGSGRPPVGLIPAAVGAGSSVLTLARPGITPDHPWADRRLVVVLLPTFVLAMTAVAAWCVRWARRRLPVSLLVAVFATAMLVVFLPAVAGSGPFVVQRTEAGEPGAVRQVCAALRPGDVVVGVDSRGYNEWPQVIRGVCNRPAAAINVQEPQVAGSIDQLGRLVSARGGRLVLLAAGNPGMGDRVLPKLGYHPRQVVSLRTVEDQRTLARAPWRSTRLSIEVWLADWQPAYPGGHGNR
jgi:hypothetical protein